jgi:uncharacterized protein (TIGR01319 family)
VNALALVDFGSTFTKVTLVDERTGRLLGRAQAPTTVESDVMEGYGEALRAALADAGPSTAVRARLAASSAGGGLRMAAIGLVPDLTAAAARQAALNAGAKVELVLAGEITAADVEALEALEPEILLFSGGTNGGQERLVLESARVAARARIASHIVVACNDTVAADVAALFERSGRGLDVVANVLPYVNVLDIEPARAAIHEAFVHHVIKGKGLSRAAEFWDLVVMPTPEAVLRATELFERLDGVGDLVVVDVGGATTDVHSVVASRPALAWITISGLPELPVLRSVQGDLGVRWSALGVLDADRDWLAAQLGGDLDEACARRRAQPSLIGDEIVDRSLDQALAVSCVTLALRRHCGRLITVYRPGQGVDFIQEGADLRDVRMLIGTGGVLVHHSGGGELLTTAISRREDHSLVPRAPTVLIDRSYVLPAAGLLSTVDPAAALTLLSTELMGGSDVSAHALQP